VGRTGGIREIFLFSVVQLRSMALWGKPVENSLIFDGLITFSHFYTQFSTAVKRLSKMGSNF
jgi:hypothetical protein